MAAADDVEVIDLTAEDADDEVVVIDVIDLTSDGDVDDDDDEVEVVWVPAPGTSPPCNQSAKRRRGPTYSCAICYNEDLESFKGYSIAACNHRYCTACLDDYIKSSLESASSAAVALTIVCPDHAECACSLSLNDIQYILRGNLNLWNQYMNKANKCALEAEIMDPASGTRRCPSPSCNYIFTFVPGVNSAEGRPLNCPSCHESYCLQCGANGGRLGPGHNGQSCAERKQELQERAEEKRKLRRWRRNHATGDEDSNKLLFQEHKNGHTKACPKCRTFITKNGGCDHMQCITCKTHFNWGPAGEPARLRPSV